MFSLTDSDTYYLYPHPTDMRKGFDTLSGIVTNEMGHDIRSGSAFIFLNRSLTGMKILHAEYGGLVIYHMRLERGFIRLPDLSGLPEGTDSVSTSWTRLMLMVQGMEPNDMRQHVRWRAKTH